MINGPYVLLIDDNSDFAKEYSETLQRICNTEIVYATTQEQALKIARENPIKVAIIDQVMPVKGTVLFKQLKQIDPNMMTILLTAEADRHDLTEAANIGFDVTLLKEEPDIDILPLKLLTLIARYNAKIIEKTLPILTEEKKTGIFKTHKITYSIAGYEIINDKYVFENSWITRDIVEKGESISYETEFNFEEDFNYSTSFVIENEAGLGISSNKMVDFKNSLSTKMASDFNNTYTESLKRIMKKKRILDLPQDQSNIVSRNYEYAKVYQQIKVYIQKHCSCCEEKAITAITVYLPIPTLKYKIVEYFSDGTFKEIQAGEIKAES